RPLSRCPLTGARGHPPRRNGSVTDAGGRPCRPADTGLSSQGTGAPNTEEVLRPVIEALTRGARESAPHDLGLAPSAGAADSQPGALRRGPGGRPRSGPARDETLGPEYPGTLRAQADLVVLLYRVGCGPVARMSLVRVSSITIRMEHSGRRH